MTPNDLQQSIEGRLSHKQITRHKWDSKEMFVSLSLILINCFHWLSGSENTLVKSRMSLLLIVSILVLLVVQEWHLLSLLQLSLCLTVSLYSETKPFYLKKWLLNKGIHQCTGKKYCSYLLRRNVYILLIFRLEKCYNVKKKRLSIYECFI